MLGLNVYTPADRIYHAWVNEGLYSPLIYDSTEQQPCIPASPEAEIILREFMKRSWKILEKTLYIRGHVFNRNTQTFDLYYMTYYIMTAHHARDPWDPGASLKVRPTPENIPIIFREKDEAVAMAESLGQLIKPAELGVCRSIREYLEFLLPAYVLFTKAMRFECRAAVLTKRAVDSKCPQHRKEALAELEPADELARQLDQLIKNKGYSNSVLYILDGERILRFKNDIAKVLAAI